MNKSIILLFLSIILLSASLKDCGNSDEKVQINRDILTEEFLTGKTFKGEVGGRPTVITFYKDNSNIFSMYIATQLGTHLRADSAPIKMTKLGNESVGFVSRGESSDPELFVDGLSVSIGRQGQHYITEYITAAYNDMKTDGILEAGKCAYDTSLGGPEKSPFDNIANWGAYYALATNGGFPTNNATTTEAGAFYCLTSNKSKSRAMLFPIFSAYKQGDDYGLVLGIESGTSIVSPTADESLSILSARVGLNKDNFTFQNLDLVNQWKLPELDFKQVPYEQPPSL